MGERLELVRGKRAGECIRECMTERGKVTFSRVGA